MTPRSIHSVLRALADSGPPVSDAELLRRHQQRDESAFAELVRRHGRLVWAVCRHLTRSDAEADDAFQATFVVLLKNAAKVRDAGKLSAWLHGVAYKVCAKSRLAAQRRQVREQAAAVREGNGSAVPDSAWDRALAAVHEEVAKLPETLRVPFVLCCLEGIGVTEAAEQLGWKLGTLSGRLTRAKDAVLQRLEARGLSLGIVASVGVVAVPAAVVAKAEALAQVGFAVPSSVLQLSQGVLGMSAKSIKVLAVAVMLACGVSLSVGTGWVANADAQQPVGPTKEKRDAEAEVQRLKAELEQAQKAAAENEAQHRLEQDRLVRRTLLERLVDAKEGPTFKTAKSEYDLVAVSDLSQAKFRELLQERETKGWEYCGTTPLTDPKQLVWVFRRPAKAGAVPPPPMADITEKPLTKGNGAVAGFYKPPSAKSQDPKAIEAEIARLTAELAELKSAKPERMVIYKDYLPLEPAEFAAFLTKSADKKFGKGRCKISVTDTGIVVEGDKEVTEWASTVVKALQPTKPGGK